MNLFDLAAGLVALSVVLAAGLFIWGFRQREPAGKGRHGARREHASRHHTWPGPRFLWRSFRARIKTLWTGINWDEPSPHVQVAPGVTFYMPRQPVREPVLLLDAETPVTYYARIARERQAAQRAYTASLPHLRDGQYEYPTGQFKALAGVS